VKRTYTSSSMLSRRKKKLVNPAFQIRWIVNVSLACGFCLAVQGFLLVVTLTRVASTLPEDGSEVIAALPGVLAVVIALSVAILLPFFAFIALSATFRVVGPIHRMENYLRDVANGETVGECKIRKGDHFQPLCSLINEAFAARETPRAKETKEPTAA
jgi:hypothetical protein